MKQVDSEDIVAVLREMAGRMGAATAYLGQLDGEIGDGDHGSTMARGSSAILRALNEVDPKSTDLSALFALSAGTFLNAVGATTGPLYAAGFLRAGVYANGRRSLDADEAPMLLAAVGDGIGSRGKAIAGDKTMMDVWLPVGQAVREARRQGMPLRDALALARAAADHGAESTRTMMAARGRAARLGERSLGHIDPGAASAAIIVGCFADVLAQRLG
ncbi:dihydroxyacetone kinase subunit DhaL [Tropicimonas sp.]|uniref:dihydroxyacetone kinase subunit DhaL n=1 Tax=Tropicimonas sp. TaxID=2067044 RepID=UPI003A84B721